MPHVQTARNTLYIADYRKPNTPHLPTLLIHGAGGTHLDWSVQLRRMPALNAIALDLAGHGMSNHSEGRSSVEAYAHDALALLEALAIPCANIAGHSMGGAIAQTIALLAPERVGKLLLFGTGALLKVNPTIISDIIEKTAETTELVVKWSWAKNTDERVLALSIEKLRACAPEVVQGDYRACDAFDLRDKVNKIQAKTLLVVGTADRMTPPRLSEFLAQQIPNSTLVLVEEGAHMVILEQAEKVAIIVSNWVDETP